jgi:hypothetical protein
LFLAPVAAVHPHHRLHWEPNEKFPRSFCLLQTPEHWDVRIHPPSPTPPPLVWPRFSGQLQSVQTLCSLNLQLFL